MRDESTGALIGYRKKFAGDMLQRSYAQLAEQFGCSEGQAKEAIVFLEQLGVVRREFRTLTSNGMVYANVLYLALNVERLKELTFPCGEISPDGCPENSDGTSDEKSPTPMPEFRGGCAEISTDLLGKFPHTNTENTTKISSETSICLSDSPADGLTAVQQTETLAKALRAQGSIPANLSQQPAKIRTLVNWLCDAEHYLQNAPERIRITPTQQKSFRLFLECLCAMACAGFCADIRLPNGRSCGTM